MKEVVSPNGDVNMKKKYSLDYSIERDTDRLKAVEDILDKLETRPTNSELEQMASYILYGKDEDGKNAVQRGETTDSNKRYNSFQRAADKVQSLDEILTNPLADQQALQKLEDRYIYTKKKPSIHRPKYDKKTGELIDIGDADIPGMQELWDCIDRLDHIVLVNEGKLPADDDTQIIKDSYRLYQLKHSLIDIRRHQYYLKDAYKPTLHFLALIPPKSQTYNWDTDAYYWMPLEQWRNRVNNALLHTISKNLEDYETRENPYTHETEVKWVVRRHTFDWENPDHIRALINNYSSIYMELQEKLDSWGRTLIYDFDRYFDMAGFTPVREFILTKKIDKLSYSQIVEELQKECGVKYNENHISTIVSKEIPERMALAAKKHRLLLTTPKWQCKKCFTCGRILPKDKLFFNTNRSHSDNFSSNCKECEKKKRIMRGEQGAYDKRSKDTPLREMPSGETRT